MTEFEERWRYRARFDATHRTYTVQLPQASITYQFEQWEPDDFDDRWTAAITKTVRQADEIVEVIAVPFAWFEAPEAFDPFVDRLLAAARQRSREDNIDEFWAVLEVVADYLADEEDDDDEAEGVFQDGLADIYLDAPAYLDGLPAQVDASARRCWRLLVARVLAEDSREALGWAVVVVHFPDLSPDADDTAIAQARRMKILDIDHHECEASAHTALIAFEYFMNDARELDPDLAYLSDVEVFELVSVQLATLHKDPIVWEIRPEVTAFLREPVIIRRDWQPIPAETLVASMLQLAAEAGTPVWLLDQYEAESRTKLGLEPPPFPEDSPFHDVFLA